MDIEFRSRNKVARDNRNANMIKMWRMLRKKYPNASKMPIMRKIGEKHGIAISTVRTVLIANNVY